MSNSLITSVKEWDVDPQLPYSSAIRADTAAIDMVPATKPVQLWQSLEARAFSLCGNATAPQSRILQMSCCPNLSVGPLTGRRKKPPPLLLGPAMVDGGASESCWKVLGSYSVGTSPVNTVTGPSQPRQKSIAMSIPHQCPRPHNSQTTGMEDLGRSSAQTFPCLEWALN